MQKSLNEEVEEKDAIRNWKNPITGEYIMETFGIAPCKEIGILKEAVKNAILDGLIDNSFDAADTYMRAQAEAIGLHPVTASYHPEPVSTGQAKDPAQNDNEIHR